MPDAPPFDRLIGTWEFTSSTDGRTLGRGRATFAWLDDGAFVRERAEDVPSDDAAPAWVENTPMPVTAVFGFDDTTGEQVMLYSDARGVFRIYRITLTDETWTLWRDAPGFNQRFVGTFRDAGRTIDGRWETAADGSTWEPDFEMTYRRIHR